MGGSKSWTRDLAGSGKVRGMVCGGGERRRRCERRRRRLTQFTNKLKIKSLMCESGSAGRQTPRGDGWGGAAGLSFCLVGDGGGGGAGRGRRREGKGNEGGVLHDNTYICPTVLFFVVSGGEGGRGGGCVGGCCRGNRRPEVRRRQRRAGLVTQTLL